MTGAILTALLLLVPLARVSAQQAGGTPSAGELSFDTIEHFRLATSSIDYPVTPGDVYRLEYRQGDAAISSQPMVEGDYTINLGVFGKVDASELTFIQVKQTIEGRILTGYPRSMPSLSISSLGIFRVYIRGETSRAQYVTAWGLMHVSDVIVDLRSPSASLRNIEIVSKSSGSHRYDLFKALRFGDESEDPLVKPGDTVILYRSERSVEIAGEVFRPGTYELLPGEQLGELVNLYGDGLTSRADASRSRIQRMSGDRPTVEYVTLASESAKTIPVSNGDVVT
ncbi:MAG: hypothetical protein NTU88_13065, partial [Armatimonadetes bacterium]|nr:hypothetical protein [Armatimonadota bacterium]